MCKPKLKCSLGSLARLSTLSIFISVLCSVYLVEYTLNPNSMIEIVPEHWPQGHCLSPMLAFLCKNLDYKPQSMNILFDSVSRSLASTYTESINLNILKLPIEM